MTKMKKRIARSGYHPIDSVEDCQTKLSVKLWGTTHGIQFDKPDGWSYEEDGSDLVLTNIAKGAFIEIQAMHHNKSPLLGSRTKQIDSRPSEGSPWCGCGVAVDEDGKRKARFVGTLETDRLYVNVVANAAAADRSSQNKIKRMLNSMQECDDEVGESTIDPGENYCLGLEDETVGIFMRDPDIGCKLKIPQKWVWWSAGDCVRVIEPSIRSDFYFFLGRLHGSGRSPDSLDTVPPFVLEPMHYEVTRCWYEDDPRIWVREYWIPNTSEYCITGEVPVGKASLLMIAFLERGDGWMRRKTNEMLFSVRDCEGGAAEWAPVRYTEMAEL